MKQNVIVIVATVASVLAVAVEAGPGGRDHSGSPRGGERPGLGDRSKIVEGGRIGAGRQRNMSAEQQQNLKKLQGDMSAIKAGSEVTPAQKDALAASLRNMADGATKPSQQSVQQLSGDLSKVLSDGKLTPKEQAQLSQDVATVMNSANISQEEAQQAAAAVTDLLKASGVGKDDLKTIQSDLQAITSTAQANAPAR